MTVVPDSPAQFNANYSEAFATSVVRSSCQINVSIALIATTGLVSPVLSFIIACVLILFLSGKAISDPRQIFYIFFGIKFTLDTLWWLSPTEDKFFLRTTELSFVPVALCAVIGAMKYRQANKTVTWMFMVFAFWCVAVQLFSSADLRLSMVVKLSGAFFGISLGQCFIANREDLNLILRLLFISTIIPIVAGLIQVVADAQFDTFVFFVTGGDRLEAVSTIRGIRYSGLYYDSGTSGICCLVAVASGVAVLRNSNLGKWAKCGYHAVISVATMLCVFGGTRSTIVLIGLTLLGFSIVNFRKSLLLILFVTFGLSFTGDKIETVLLRSNKEIERSNFEFDFDTGSLLRDQGSRQLLTGRMGIWQDVYEIYESRPISERLLGSGISSDAHSSYFFLLLFVGSLGLLYYVLIHMLLIIMLFRLNPDNKMRIIAIGCVLAILLLGFSLTAVVYTSIQWVAYLIVGGAIGSDFKTIGVYPQI